MLYDDTAGELETSPEVSRIGSRKKPRQEVRDSTAPKQKGTRRSVRLIYKSRAGCSSLILSCLDLPVAGMRGANAGTVEARPRNVLAADKVPGVGARTKYQIRQNFLMGVTNSQHPSRQKLTTVSTLANSSFW